jgi:predicted  nucleic acid-binding Zn-ribbon protein
MEKNIYLRLYYEGMREPVSNETSEHNKYKEDKSETITDLETRLKNLQEQYVSLEQENHALNASTNDTSDDETKNIHDTEVIQRLNVEIDQLSKILDTTAKKEIQNHDLNEELKRELKETVQELTKIELIFNENTQLFDNLKRKHEKLYESFIRLNKTKIHGELLNKNRLYNENLRKLNHKIDTQSRRIKELEESNNKAESTIFEMSKRNETMQIKLKGNINENQVSKQYIQSLERDQDGLHAKNKSIEHELNTIKTNHDKSIEIYNSLLMLLFAQKGDILKEIIIDNPDAMELWKKISTISTHI